jgi:hypothetical protein
VSTLKKGKFPPHIVGNLLEFMRRVQSTGTEAVAWVEAYQFLQRRLVVYQLSEMRCPC